MRKAPECKDCGKAMRVDKALMEKAGWKDWGTIWRCEPCMKEGKPFFITIEKNK